MRDSRLAGGRVASGDREALDEGGVGRGIHEYAAHGVSAIAAGRRVWRADDECVLRPFGRDEADVLGGKEAAVA